MRSLYYKLCIEDIIYLEIYLSASMEK